MFKELPGKSGKFRTKTIAKGITILVGKLKKAPKGKANSMVVQAYRFSKSSYTATQAKAWLTKNKVSYIKFEKAGGSTSTKKTNEAVTLSDLADNLRARLVGRAS
jgi:hypothetical protein